ncbi:MAG: tripartite tricarboxylate transporter TctB family protein [Pseudomonadota bacterium]
MFSNKDVLAGLTFVIFGIITLAVLIPVGIQQPPSVQYRALSPSYWPNIVAGAITALGLALLIASVLAERSRDQADGATNHLEPAGSVWLAVRPLVALAICFALYFGLEPLGFVLTTSIALVALMVLAGEYRPQIVIPVALIVPIALHLFFTKAASVPIPMGILEPLLLRI